MAGPLAGVRVLDLTAMASGPFATQVLGDQGADVIKVEPPGTGDPIRSIGTSRGGMSAVFANMNRNKRSLALNLRNERGSALLRRLAARADVFVQNFRPGVAQRLGIGDQALRAQRPELIYVSISGFGETGPYAGYKVYDSVMQAFSGLADLQADPETGTPQFVRNIVCDKSTALVTAQAITAALFARAQGAGGQHLRLAMLDAAIGFLWPDGMQNHTYLGMEAPAPLSAVSPRIRATADGFATFNAVQEAEFQGLCRAVGRPDLASDARFADARERMRNAQALHDTLDEVVRGYGTHALVARLREHDVPFAVVNRVDALHEDPQVVANGLLVESEHPSAGPMRTPRPAPRFEATPTELRLPAPRLGEHSDEILAELGVRDAELRTLREEGVVG